MHTKCWRKSHEMSDHYVHPSEFGLKDSSPASIFNLYYLTFLHNCHFLASPWFILTTFKTQPPVLTDFQILKHYQWFKMAARPAGFTQRPKSIELRDFDNDDGRQDGDTYAPESFGRRTEINKKCSCMYCLLCCFNCIFNCRECFSKGGAVTRQGVTQAYRGIGLVYLLPSLCCAIWTLLGVCIAFIRVGQHFTNMFVEGYEYFEENLISIGSSTGALATTLAAFYKLHLLKVAYRRTYTEWYQFVLGYLVVVALYVLLVIFCTFCASELIFYLCIVAAGVVTIVAPILAHFKYAGEVVEIITSKDDKVDPALAECNSRRCLELFTMLFAAVSFAVGTGIIVISLTTMNDIFSWSTDCRDNTIEIDNEDYDGKSILDSVIFGIFMTASAMGKLADTKFRHRNRCFKICFIIFLIGPILLFIIKFGVSDSEFGKNVSIVLMTLMGTLVIVGLGTILFHDGLE